MTAPPTNANWRAPGGCVQEDRRKTTARATAPRRALFVERLQHALGNAPWPLAQTECAGRITARIDLDHLGANRDLDAAPCQTPQHAAYRRAQRESVLSTRRTSPSSTRSPMRAAVSNRPAGRRIDEACAADTANRSRLAGKRQCCAGFDDLAEPLAPHCFNREIDGFAGDEIRAEADCQRSNPALSFRHSALAHARIDHRRPSRRLEHFGKRHDRDRHDIAGSQSVRAARPRFRRAERSRPSRVAQPSNTASAKAMPRRGVAGAGSSCSATRVTRRETARRRPPIRHPPTPRTSTAHALAQPSAASRAMADAIAHDAPLWQLEP